MADSVPGVSAKEREELEEQADKENTSSRRNVSYDFTDPEDRTSSRPESTYDFEYDDDDEGRNPETELATKAEIQDMQAIKKNDYSKVDNPETVNIFKAWGNDLNKKFGGVDANTGKTAGGIETESVWDDDKQEYVLKDDSSRLRNFGNNVVQKITGAKDTDKDGKYSGKEMGYGALEKYLGVDTDKADKNKDGKLSFTEVMGNALHNKWTKTGQKFGWKDTDNDGTNDEWSWSNLGEALIKNVPIALSHLPGIVGTMAKVYRASKKAEDDINSYMKASGTVAPKTTTKAYTEPESPIREPKLLDETKSSLGNLNSEDEENDNGLLDEEDNSIHNQFMNGLKNGFKKIKDNVSSKLVSNGITVSDERIKHYIAGLDEDFIASIYKHYKNIDRDTTRKNKETK